MNQIKAQQLAKEKLLTQEQLKELLSYDSDAGLFFWKTCRSRRMKDGDIAGTISNQGYRYIGINGKQYLAHRLAWLYVKGEWPEEQIDHKNLNKSDNRFENLREATPKQNRWNRKTNKNNTTGYTGVSFDKHLQKYRSYFQHDGKRKHLGYFDSPKEAHKAYFQEAKELHGEFANTE